MSSHLRQLPFFRLGLSFWSGIASLADPLGEAARSLEADEILSGPESDRAALEGDFHRIGGDFRRAMAEIDEQVSR
jgi:hypothetical protein